MHDSVSGDVAAGRAGHGPESAAGPAVGSSYPSTPPKVVDGRQARRGSGVLRRVPAVPDGPSIGVHAVRSIARSRTQERCLCRLPGRTIKCHLRLGGPPSSEGRGDRGGKRCRLRSAEAAQPAGSGPPGVSAAGSRARRIGGSVPVTGRHAGQLGRWEPGSRGDGGFSVSARQAQQAGPERPAGHGHRPGRDRHRPGRDGRWRSRDGHRPGRDGLRRSRRSGPWGGGKQAIGPRRGTGHEVPGVRPQEQGGACSHG